jgi:hypothetical protein
MALMLRENILGAEVVEEHTGDPPRTPAIMTI